MHPQTVDPPLLNDQEFALLKDFAEDLQNVDADAAALAHLERLGLLMRGWAGTHVVTALGQRLLRG